MKIENIISSLRKKSYEVDFEKFHYWDSQPFVMIDGNRKLFLCEVYTANNSTGCNNEFKLQDVIDAILKCENKIPANSVYAPCHEWNCKIEMNAALDMGLYLKIEKEYGW